MNSAIYEDWIEHKLLPSITERYCIVMDNALYRIIQAFQQTKFLQERGYEDMVKK